MARPTKLTTEVIEEIAKHIKKGVWPETAARLAGVSARSYYRSRYAQRPVDLQHPRGCNS
jgi:hypothetical protein